MDDIVTEIFKYLKKDETTIEEFLYKYSEFDIVNLFLKDLNELKFSFSSFLKVITVEALGGISLNINYSKNIYKYSMFLLFNYNNHHAISKYEPRVRRLCNTYTNSDHNIVTVLNVIKSIINNVINYHDRFKKYEGFKISIIFTVVNSLNKNFSSCLDTDYKINMINVN